jgi:hypothetical protein
LLLNFLFFFSSRKFSLKSFESMSNKYDCTPVMVMIAKNRQTQGIDPCPQELHNIVLEKTDHIILKQTSLSHSSKTECYKVQRYNYLLIVL